MISNAEIVYPVESQEEVTSLSASILRVLLYYDLFQFPLTAEEILRHCGYAGCKLSQVAEVLDELVDAELVYRKNDYYLLQDDPARVARRIQGELGAAQALKIAERKSRFIAAFPFVRSICISGSLSKNYFDKTTDIDYFIITEPGRLWLCRSLLILYKKIFLLNSKKYFCVNYFIDTHSLRIPDNNIFTATELITLMPVYNEVLYRKLFNENSWVKDFYPNSTAKKARIRIPSYNNRFKRFTEQLLSGKVGEWLDRYFFRITIKFWQKKFTDFSEEEFDVNLRSRKNVSKHHPRGFQFRILKQFEEKCDWFEAQHHVILR